MYIKDSQTNNRRFSNYWTLSSLVAEFRNLKRTQERPSPGLKANIISGFRSMTFANINK